MLDTWQDSYLEVRARIESSGRDARWEFDKKRLFERTGYMSQICQDLQDIAQVSQEVRIALLIEGPELRSVDCRLFE